MGRTITKNRHCLTTLLLVVMAGSLSASVYAKDKIKVIKQKHKKQKQSQNIEAAAEPDKILYERALQSEQHSKYTESRLELQTLINTYPDSEYLAKAKLAIADSFYKEGGVSNLTQAIDAYKSFIVFFPFLDEAQYAQMQVALCHYRMMLKSDRDPSEAESAENELQNFILKYPQSALLPKAEQDLRNVQEVIADGEYKIGRFYYMKPDYPAAAARLMDVAERYPLYSQSDDALWMLGNIYMIDRKFTKNEDVKNKWADYAGKCYSRILRDYPLSEHASYAREQLKAMGMAVPSADPHAIARMQHDQLYEKKHHEMALMRWPKEMIDSRPETKDAARVGMPNLNPPDDTISATDVLNPRIGPVPTFTVASAPVTANNSDDSAGEAVPINAEPQAQADDAAPTTTAGAQIISTGDPSDLSGANSAPTGTGDPATTTPTPAAAPAAPSVLAPVGTDTGTSAVDNSATSGTTSASNPAAASTNSPAAPNSASPQQAAPASATAANTKPAAAPKAAKVDPKTESTSKKKHGLHKIVPW